MMAEPRPRRHASKKALARKRIVDLQRVADRAGISRIAKQSELRGGVTRAARSARPMGIIPGRSGTGRTPRCSR